MPKQTLLEWAKPRLGNLRALKRRGGLAYSFRWMLGKVSYSKNFPAGTSEEFIKARVLEIESQVRDFRNGIGEGPGVQHRRRERLSLREMTEFVLDAGHKEGLAIPTLENKEIAMKYFIAWIGSESFPADDVTRRHLNEYSRYLIDERGYTGIGARSTLSLMQTVFKKAHYEEKILSYPFLGFKYPRAGQSRERPRLSLVEMKEMAGLFASEKTRLAWHIARLTGMRAGDVRKIEAERIDHNKRIIEFWAAKTHRYERIPFHPALSEIVAPLRDKTGLVFDYRNFRTLAYEFGLKIKEFKGPDFRPSGGHTPRHSVTDYLRNVAGWRWEDIQQFLCHHPQSVTARYTHDSIERLRDLVDQLPFE